MAVTEHEWDALWSAILVSIRNHLPRRADNDDVISVLADAIAEYLAIYIKAGDINSVKSILEHIDKQMMTAALPPPAKKGSPILTH